MSKVYDRAYFDKWYRERFREAGLLACGSHAWLGPRLLRSVAALECL